MINNKIRFGNIKWILFLLILFIIISVLFFLSYREVKRNAVIEFNKQQMILAEQAASGITEFFSTLNGELEFLINIDDVTELNLNGKKILTDYLDRKKPVLTSITRVNRDGKIIWLAPYNEKLIGMDISSQKHVQYLLKNRTPTLSDVFPAVQGYRTIAFHYPIKEKGKFQGSLALLINFEYISKKYLEQITIGGTGYAWMISRDGVIIYDPVPGISGISIYETLRQFPDVIKTAESMMRGEKGTSAYRYNYIKDKHIELTLKHTAYTPVSIMNTHWSIAVSTPEEYITANVRGFRNKSIIIMFLLIGIGAVFIYFNRKNILLSREIENRKKNEDILKSQEENLRITLNSIGDAVIATDEKGIIRRMNPAAEKTTGWSFSESEGIHISEIFISAHRTSGTEFESPFDLVLKKREKIDLLNNTNLIKKSGVIIEISGSYAPIYDSAGAIVGVILVFRDITEKNKMEEQLHQTQKMDVVGQLAGGIAHDFNNMLSGIMGSAELLSHETAGNPRLKKYIDTIIESSKRSSSLTSQLLAFSRKGKTVSTSVDIHVLIKAAIDLLERSIDKNISIVTGLNAVHSFTIGDPTLLQNAFLNLSINARDAMPEGGTITISTSDVTVDSGMIKLNSFTIDPGPYIEITISDTGIGIPKENISRIFDPFFTTKPAGKGTGLGLSGVYGTVSGHQGAVTVFSEPGKGATFKLYLPRGDESSVNVNPQENSITRGSGGILVIDDESTIRITAQRILSAAGYDVFLAEDGISGIEIYASEKKRISLVVLDMIMPKISGKETFIRLREINPDIKVVFTSGFDNEGTVQDILNSGAKGFIQKPYLISEFTRVVDEVIRSVN